MDPNATLHAIREFCRAIAPEEDSDDVLNLIEHVKALDEWLSRGGAMPDEWNPDYTRGADPEREN